MDLKLGRFTLIPTADTLLCTKLLQPTKSYGFFILKSMLQKEQTCSYGSEREEVSKKAKDILYQGSSKAGNSGLQI